MRLIDADELKKAIKKELPQMSNWGETFIPSLIDNAPTVEPTFGLFRALFCEDCQAYATNRAIVKLADEYTKPQAANNAELFKQTFGIYATELWTMSNEDFMEWLDSNIREEGRNEQ